RPTLDIDHSIRGGHKRSSEKNGVTLLLLLRPRLARQSQLAQSAYQLDQVRPPQFPRADGTNGLQAVGASWWASTLQAQAY
ncbi:Unknown protein, partial [Striga hermonthica]